MNGCVGQFLEWVGAASVIALLAFFGSTTISGQSIEQTNHDAQKIWFWILFYAGMFLFFLYWVRRNQR